MAPAATNATKPGSSADGVAWELSDLYPSTDSPALTLDLDAALGRARAFEATYRGRIEPGPDVRLLSAALTELEGLFEQMDRPAIYASLLHAAKTDDPRHGALLMQTRERRTAINKHLIFFDLEWIQVPDRR
jgi:oligoendopeptidase F